MSLLNEQFTYCYKGRIRKDAFPVEKLKSLKQVLLVVSSTVRYVSFPPEIIVIKER